MENSKLLGEGKISKLLLKFSIPCVMGLLISAFYNIVDQIFIGNSTLGYLGNAATGISFPIICIANAFAWCIGDGVAAFLSICSGRNDRETAHKCVGTGMSSSFIVSVVLLAICLVFQKPLMIMFGASDKTLCLAIDYFKIITTFFPFYLLSNVMNSMIRADGSPTYAMVGMTTGAIINIILDPIFIFVMNWGIKGAAIATVIGQIISFFICAIYFRKPKSFVLTKQSFKIDFSILKNLINLGGATFITQIGIVIMTLLSNVTLAHYGSLSKFGSDIPISVFSIQTKVYTIVSNLVVGIALGSQPILGFNYGANKLDRVKETYKLVFISSLIVGFCATIMFEFFPSLIINIFGTGNALYQEFALKTFRIYLSLSFITCIIKMTAVFFQSIGKSVQAMVSSVIRDIVCFVILTVVLSIIFETKQQGYGIYGILFAAPLSDFIAGIVVVILTVRFFKTLNNQVESGEETVTIEDSQLGVIVAITREHGSRGKQVGRMVSEKLGIPFYYKEMTALAAQESGLDKDFISDINENSSKIFHQLYLSSDVIQQAIIAQEHMTREIASRGSCVLVGRAANYVLKDYENVVSIFLYAPKEERVKNIMEMYGDSYEEAKEHMHHSDKARESYYKNISGKNWKDMDNYDFCIDTSIGTENVCQLIVDYIENKKK